MTITGKNVFGFTPLSFTSVLSSYLFLPAALRAAQICRYWFFAPQGRHVAPMGVKFGMEEPSSVPNFTPIGATSANDKGVGPQN